MSLIFQASDTGWMVGTGLAALGGLLPDIDEPESLVGHSPQVLARGASWSTRRQPGARASSPAPVLPARPRSP